MLSMKNESSHNTDTLRICRNSLHVKNIEYALHLPNAPRASKPNRKFVRPQHVGVGLIAGYPLAAEAFVHDTSESHSLEFRKAASVILYFCRRQIRV